MPEKTLYIFFVTYDRLYRFLPAIFWNRRDRLKGFNLLYQGFYNPFWQRYTLEQISGPISALADPASSYKRKAINRGNLINIRLQLEKDASSQNLVWLFGPIPATAIGILKKWLDQSEILAGYKIKPLLAVQRQDYSFGDSCRLGWKDATWTEVVDLYMAPNAFAYYDDTYSRLAESFGAENCAILPYDQYLGPDAALADFLGGVAKQLEIDPALFASSWPDPFPQSYAGLDMTYACRDFPFSKGDRPVFDRDAFFAMLAEVEREQGFALFPPVPLPEAADIMDSLAPQNAALSKKLGRQIFRDARVGWGEKQNPLPVITIDEYLPFVEAMPDNLRQGLMRYFREKSDLSLEQHNLAQAFENYRARHVPASPFCWPRKKPLLTVLTMTRNHKNFILDCMEGVTSQQTDFEVEHLILDDASDDGTQDVVDNYASAHAHVRPIYLPYRTGGDIRTLFNACKSPFAALCDGDDYFTDPHKLQLQVDYLNENMDCALCFHPVLVKFENSARQSFVFPGKDDLPNLKNNKFYLANLIRGNFIQTNSVVYRWRFADGLPDWFRADLCPGDWYWHILHAEKGKIGYLPQLMSVYRRHEHSLYNNAFINSTEHRRAHGLRELETYKVINEHFNNRYFKPLSQMANGVMREYTAIFSSDDDSSYLDRACELYPDFTRQFLQDLKMVHKLHPAKKPEIYMSAADAMEKIEAPAAEKDKQ